jgi:hypothetical protein
MCASSGELAGSSIKTKGQQRALLIVRAAEFCVRQREYANQHSANRTAGAAASVAGAAAGSTALAPAAAAAAAATATAAAGATHVTAPAPTAARTVSTGAAATAAPVATAPVAAAPVAAAPVAAAGGATASPPSAVAMQELWQVVAAFTDTPQLTSVQNIALAALKRLQDATVRQSIAQALSYVRSGSFDVSDERSIRFAISILAQEEEM